MKTLSAVFTDLKNRISDAVPAVHIGVNADPSASADEFPTVSADALPSVLISLNEIGFEEHNLVRVLHLTLILTDSFSADPEARTLSALTLCETLQTLFPPEGVVIDGVLYLPGVLTPEAPDGDSLCCRWRFSLTAKE